MNFAHTIGDMPVFTEIYWDRRTVQTIGKGDYFCDYTLNKFLFGSNRKNYPESV